jgi:hypothetical protein
MFTEVCDRTNPERIIAMGAGYVIEVEYCFGAIFFDRNRYCCTGWLLYQYGINKFPSPGFERGEGYSM